MPAQERNQTGGEAETSRKGCLKGCLVALGIVVIFFVGFFIQRSYMAEHMVRIMNKSIIEKLPEDYDREKVEQAYSDFMQGTKSGTVTQQEINEMYDEVTEALSDGELTEKELDELIEKASKASEK